MKKLLLIIGVLIITNTYGVEKQKPSKSAIDNTKEKYEVIWLSSNIELKDQGILLDDGRVLFYSSELSIYNPTNNTINDLDIIKKNPKHYYIKQVLQTNSSNYLILAYGKNDDYYIYLFALKTEKLELVKTINGRIEAGLKMPNGDVLFNVFSPYKGFMRYSNYDQQIYDEIHVDGLEFGAKGLNYKNILYAMVNDQESKEKTEEYNKYKESKQRKYFYKIKKYNPSMNIFENKGIFEINWSAPCLFIAEDKLMVFDGQIEYEISSYSKIIDLNNPSDPPRNAKINIPRRIDNIVFLDDGNVLITNGEGEKAAHSIGKWDSLDNVELYVASENRYIVYNTKNKRMRGEAIKLKNGSVMIYGFCAANDETGFESKEIDIFRQKNVNAIPKTTSQNIVEKKYFFEKPIPNIVIKGNLKGKSFIVVARSQSDRIEIQYGEIIIYLSKDYIWFFNKTIGNDLFKSKRGFSFDSKKSYEENKMAAVDYDLSLLKVLKYDFLPLVELLGEWNNNSQALSKKTGINSVEVKLNFKGKINKVNVDFFQDKLYLEKNDFKINDIVSINLSASSSYSYEEKMMIYAINWRIINLLNDKYRIFNYKTERENENNKIIDLVIVSSKNDETEFIRDEFIPDYYQIEEISGIKFYVTLLENGTSFSIRRDNKTLIFRQNFPLEININEDGKASRISIVEVFQNKISKKNYYQKLKEEFEGEFRPFFEKYAESGFYPILRDIKETKLKIDGFKLRDKKVFIAY